MKKFMLFLLPAVLLALTACEKLVPDPGTRVIGNLSDEVNIECCYPEGTYSISVDKIKDLHLIRLPLTIVRYPNPGGWTSIWKTGCL